MEVIYLIFGLVVIGVVLAVWLCNTWVDRIW